MKIELLKFFLEINKLLAPNKDVLGGKSLKNNKNVLDFYQALQSRSYYLPWFFQKLINAYVPGKNKMLRVILSEKGTEIIAQAHIWKFEIFPCSENNSEIIMIQDAQILRCEFEVWFLFLFQEKNPLKWVNYTVVLQFMFFWLLMQL